MEKDKLIFRKIAKGVIHGYRWILSPWVGYHCRFTPTCSAYALQAIDAYGVLRGSFYILCRIGRCHPWAKGGYDPLPGCECQTNKIGK